MDEMHLSPHDDHALPPFGAAESRRLLDLVVTRSDLDDVPVGALSVALADIRVTVDAVYGRILPELERALGDPAIEPERAHELLDDLRLACRRLDADVQRVGWDLGSPARSTSLIDLRAVRARDFAP
jgi:hypothetical protein